MSDEQVSAFVDITGATAEQARFFLESCNNNVEDAVNAFLEGGAAMLDSTPTQPPPPQAQPRQLSPPPSPYRFENTDTPSGALHRTSGEMATGGLSALVGQGSLPQNQKDPQQTVSDLFTRAKEQGAMTPSEAQATRQTNFTGTGYSLGDANSSAPPQAVQGNQPPLERTLTFWSEGISIDDGPLQNYSTPAVKAILTQIHRGVVPRELVDPTQPWREVELNLIDKKTEKYSPPPKKFTAFEGSGQTLSSSTPRTEEGGAPSDTVAPRGLTVDENAPITSISIRLSSGTRLVAKFNHSHTVMDLYAFVRSSQSTRQPFELLTTFPKSVLKNMNQTLKEANLLNASVVQNML